MTMRSFRHAVPLVVLLLALAWPGVARAQDAEAAEAAYQAGYAALQASNWQECVSQFRSALQHGGEAYERWGWIHMSLGICLGQRQQRDEAISELQTAKELVATDVERFQTNHALAQVYVSRANSGDYDRAIAAENEASQYAADANQRALVAKTLGQAYYFKEDWRNAIQHLAAAAEGRSSDSDVAQKLARAHYEAGNVDDAMQWFQTTQQLDQNNSTAAIYIGRIHLDRRNWAEATRALERAVRAEPQNMQARNMLGRAHLGAGNYTEAVRQLEQVVQERRTDGNAHYNLGQAYKAAENNAKAIEAFTNALNYLADGTPTRAACLYDIGFVYEAVGRYEDALSAYEDSSEIAAETRVTEAIDRVKERIRRAKESGSR